MPASRPGNLLVIISDEHRRDAMGCAGHPLVKTPHLDRLAAGGAVFENAYTPSPMCVPARAAIATGLPVHRTGCWDSATPYCGRPRSWMHALRDRGCDVVSIGKLHFRSGADDNGFGEEILPLHVVDGVGWPAGLLREDPAAFTGAAELAADVGVGTSPYTDYDLEITAAAEHWLGARAGRSDPAERPVPWAAFVSLVSPHFPLIAPPAFHALYDPSRIDLPIAYEQDRRPTHREVRSVARFFDYDRHFDETGLRAAKVAYYGLISFMDACVGRLLAALDRSGQAEDTTILYISDHGDMMGDHGLWTKQVMYEGSAAVPMILAGPGVPPGRRVRTAANLTDLAPTALAIAGVQEPGLQENDLPGRSLTALATESDDPDRTILSEYHDGGSTTGTFMVRWQGWKYVHYVGEAPQLFDLRSDPGELEDLAARPDAVVRAALAEGQRRLGTFCDPDSVNATCFPGFPNKPAARGLRVGRGVAAAHLGAGFPACRADGAGFSGSAQRSTPSDSISA